MVKTSRRGGLGRGLGALIQNTSEADPATTPAAGASTTDETSVPAKKATDSARGRRVTDDKAEAASASTDKGSDARPTTAPRKGPSVGMPSTSGESPSLPPMSPPTADVTDDASTPLQRPADIFFTRTDDAGEDRRKRSSKAGRPAMPVVTAPGRRTADAASSETDTAAASQDQDAAAPEDHHATVSPDIAVLRELPVGDIHPNPRQPREVFDEEHMAELVTSITEVGILQPIVVREVPDASTPYELIMGERRWRATQEAGLATIPAIVRQTPDQDLLRDALLENLHRSELNPLEEAAAYQQLMEDFSCTQEELSRRIGRSRPQISNTMRLLRLPPLVQRRVAAGTLSAGHARALLGLEDPAEMERLAQRIVSDGLSVRATEEAVAQLQGAVRPAPKATRGRDDSTRHERLDYFATALTSRLDTQVKITLGARKGRIAIDFTSVEDLNRIMDLIQGEGRAGQADAAR